MSHQQPERIPYNMVSVPAFVYFKNDYQLIQFIGAFNGQPKAGLQPFIPLMIELTFCRAVDNYLAYISDLLTLILTTRPEVLKSSKETIPLDLVLRYSSYDDLLRAVTEQKVMNLSFMGIHKLDDHLKTQLKFALFEESADLEQAVRIVEIRNLFTHNRGILSTRFVERVPGFNGKAGLPIQIPVETLADDLVFLQKTVQDIDFRAGRKFRLLRSCPLFGGIPPKPAQ